MTDDLVAFLRARLDEAAADAERLSGEEWAWCFSMPSGGETHGRLSVVTTGTDPITGEQAKFSHPNDPFATLPKDAADRYGDRMLHIARHDPAHVLHDIAAKRRIMARHTPDEDHADVDSVLYGTPPRLPCRGCGTNMFGEWISPTTDDCPELRDLATVYDQHPEYRETWRP